MPSPAPAAPQLCLHDLRGSLEGGVPAVMATCSAEGVPNVTLASQVYFVDERHVALSFQFFNKTHQNIRSNPQASVQLMNPETGAAHRLHLRYVRTETQGPLYESMRAQLAGIASHLGMGEVYALRGSDVYAVERIEALDDDALPAAPPRRGLLNAARLTSESMAHCETLDALLDALLEALVAHAGVQHAMVLMRDVSAGPAHADSALYTVGSIGYARSGVGSEVQIGQGVIGVAAAARTPVRINRVTQASLYAHAVRAQALSEVPDIALACDIPFPGLAQPSSQLAVPVTAGGVTLGVLFIESPRELAFSFEDEDFLMTVAAHLGAAIAMLRQPDDAAATLAAGAAPTLVAQHGAPALVVKHYQVNDSVFLDDVYLIKGVAGAILWKLLRAHADDQRTAFSNRELRLAPELGLPDLDDNLEARLLLLRRRLQEQSPHIRLERSGRGRLSLQVGRPLKLIQI